MCRIVLSMAEFSAGKVDRKKLRKDSGALEGRTSFTSRDLHSDGLGSNQANIGNQHGATALMIIITLGDDRQSHNKTQKF